MRDPEYIADTDELMRAAIEAYAGRSGDADAGSLPTIQDAVALIVAEYGQDRAAAALDTPRRTLRRWSTEGAAKTAKARARQDVVRLAAAKIQASRNAVAKLAAVKTVIIEYHLIFSSTDTTRTTKFKVDPTRTPDQCRDTAYLAGKASSGKPLNPMAAVAGRYAAGAPDLAGPIIGAMEPPPHGFYGSVFSHQAPDARADILGVAFE